MPEEVEEELVGVMVIRDMGTKEIEGVAGDPVAVVLLWY